MPKCNTKKEGGNAAFSPIDSEGLQCALVLESQGHIASFKDDEVGRLAALERLDILDTDKEQAFETIVALAKQVFDVPICAISLIDQKRQWFKASQGLDVRETARDVSFCTHAIKASEPMIIDDALSDQRVCLSPLVLGPPHIRSYAGVPLTTPEGYNIGTICIIDTKARLFSDHQVSLMQNFASLVLAHIELRQTASLDGLTGVLSRAAWTNRAVIEVSRAARHCRPLSLLALDMDRFKMINDRFGHPTGDKVLERFCATVKPLLRKSDLFGRYGGEEFVLLLPETTYKEAMQLARRIHLAVRADIHGKLDDLNVTVSAGVTELWPDERSLESLFERADRALYLAKKNGRDRAHGIATPIENRKAA